jgi:alpha-maltose-1-phosphate synthase
VTLAPGGDRLNVALCTREFPPDGYGGTGVHVGYLAEELSNYVNLTVECQGADRSTAVAPQPWIGCRTPTLRCQTSSTELSMVADMNNADLCIPTPGTQTRSAIWLRCSTTSRMS